MIRNSDDKANRSAPCTCKRSASISRTKWPRFYGPTLLVKSSHRCPLHPFKPVETTVLIDVPLVNRFLNYSFQLGLSVKAYASGHSFYPELRATRRVSRNSAIFERVARLPDRILQTSSCGYSGPRVSELLQNLRQDIYNVFVTGESYPTDVNEDGDTILTSVRLRDASSKWHALIVSKKMFSPDFFILYILQSSDLLRFGQILLELADYGVPINEISSRGYG